jgi:hypothetical protein
MNESETQRTDCLDRITERQRQATALCIQLKMEAEEIEDTQLLAEAEKTLVNAVHELEHAKRVLVGAHAGPDPLDIYATVIG